MQLTVEKLLQLADELPSVSPAAIKILDIIDNPNTSREEIVKTISSDEVLFAYTFKYANSAAKRVVKEVKTLNEIVELMGFNVIKEVATIVAAKSIIGDKRIWEESVFIATAAKNMAQRDKFDTRITDQLYMAGLFQNYGSFILLHHFRAIYQDILEIKNIRKRLNQEKKTFGVNHFQATAKVLEDYNIPEYTLSIIKRQSLIYKFKEDEVVKGEMDDKQFNRELTRRRLPKENIYLEIARLLYKHQGMKVANFMQILKDPDRVYHRLISRPDLANFDLDSKFVDAIKEEAFELASF